MVDTEGNTSLGLGIGITPSEDFFIDLAYQYGMFPEIEEEFGTASALTIGITFRF